MAGHLSPFDELDTVRYCNPVQQNRTGHLWPVFIDDPGTTLESVVVDSTVQHSTVLYQGMNLWPVFVDDPGTALESVVVHSIGVG